MFCLLYTQRLRGKAGVPYQWLREGLYEHQDDLAGASLPQQVHLSLCWLPSRPCVIHAPLHNSLQTAFARRALSRALNAVHVCNGSVCDHIMLLISGLHAHYSGNCSTDTCLCTMCRALPPVLSF